MLGYHRFRWPANSGIWIFPLLINEHQQQQQKKNVVKVGPPLTKLSGSAHEIVSCKGFIIARPSLTKFQKHSKLEKYVPGTITM